ncbi:natural cytotoxicity triggering receptor 1 [Saccopteryx bilineata]|uniref:natural cytotoxicity triggering receptor 1 n=1 Tax=Saccopteryx bilineata TaxID=59482 RepID=UPI00338E0226
MIPNKMSVIIWCQGTRKAIEYQLHFDGHLSALKRPKQTGVSDRVPFPIRRMTTSTAGQYKCFYQSGELWSGPSDPLDLVVTGKYDTPTLTVHPGSEVTPGENVTFYCQLKTGTSMFFLLKEGRASRPQRTIGSSQANFTVGPVTTAHRGTYRCFGSYNNYIWSFPSEPVRLLVTGDVGDTDLATTEQPSSPDLWELYLFTTKPGFQKDLTLQDHSAENLLQIGLALLVLLALVGLLAEDWLCKEKAKERAGGDSSQERRRRLRSQREPWTNGQEMQRPIYYKPESVSQCSVLHFNPDVNIGPFIRSSSLLNLHTGSIHLQPECLQRPTTSFQTLKEHCQSTLPQHVLSQVQSLQALVAGESRHKVPATEGGTRPRRGPRPPSPATPPETRTDGTPPPSRAPPRRADSRRTPTSQPLRVPHVPRAPVPISLRVAVQHVEHGGQKLLDTEVDEGVAALTAGVLLEDAPVQEGLEVGLRDPESPEVFSVKHRRLRPRTLGSQETHSAQRGAGARTRGATGARRELAAQEAQKHHAGQSRVALHRLESSQGWVLLAEVPQEIVPPVPLREPLHLDEERLFHQEPELAQGPRARGDSQLIEPIDDEEESLRLGEDLGAGFLRVWPLLGYQLRKSAGPLAAQVPAAEVEGGLQCRGDVVLCPLQHPLFGQRGFADACGAVQHQGIRGTSPPLPAAFITWRELSSSVSEAVSLRPAGQRRPGMMSLVLPTLLYLGHLPPPVLTAQPGTRVPFRKPVTILCRGPPDAKEYLIYKVSGPKRMDRRNSLVVPGRTNTVTDMRPDHTGLYSCSYRNGEQWSPLSDPLHLVMTGAYDKPSFTNLSAIVVASGDSVKVQCFSRLKFDEFFLTKEDAPHSTQNQSSTPQDNRRQAIFHMDHVTSTQTGTYRCYGAFSKDPDVWSEPSDPLQLVVREAPNTTDPTEPGRPNAPAGWSISVENQVRLGLAGLTLLVLGILVAEAWYGQKRLCLIPRLLSPSSVSASRISLRPAGQRGPGMMSLVVPTLLYLGLYLGQGTRAQEGRLPPPVLTAQPGTRVSSRKHVTFLCRGPPEAKEYLIYKVNGSKRMDRRNSLVAGRTNTVTIAEMTPDQTGLYSCSYGNGEQWSKLSDPLRLVMTGAYDKPLFTNLSAIVVASGNSVKVQCFSRFKFDKFILTKEDAPHCTQNQSSTPQGNGRQAIFHVDHVTSTQTGTYRCYGAFSKDPDVWSEPSDPLQLVVREAPDSADPTEPGRPHDQKTQQQQHLLIGLPVAIMLLLVLLLSLLFILHRRRKAKNNAARTQRQPEAVEPITRQASEAIDPQDVTYFQVAFNAPTQGTASTPSRLAKETQTSDYATLALR